MVANRIEDQSKRGWSVKINGEVVEDVAHLELANPRFGVLEYGNVGGYDSWNFHENGGGGSVIAPHAIVGGYLFVLMIEQGRPNQGGRVWNLPRGFLNPSENHFGTAVRELEEEAGIRSVELKQLGDPTNPNSAFFVTSGEGEGTRFYGLRIDESEIKPEGAIEDGVFLFNEGAIKPISKTAEDIFGGKFFRYEEALAVGDMYTVAAVGRLAYAWLNNQL
jgi:ADP-ribose pyrophosphatase YjhB (NUDIX family)